MPIRVTKYQPTPNPNALKCFLDSRISAGPRSFRTAVEGADDPVAAPLLAVPGVAGLLLNGDWLTVNKAPGADWAIVKQGVERVLGALGEG
jgi:hypothetical protein